jgi:hypothetical protein
MMETRDDEGASFIIFTVERDAAGEDVGASTRVDVAPHV